MRYSHPEFNVLIAALLLAVASCTGGEVALEWTPSGSALQVSMPVPDAVELAPGRYLCQDGDTTVPVEVLGLSSKGGDAVGKGRRLVAVLPASSGERPRRLVLKPDAGATKSRFLLKPIADKSLELSEGENRVFAYHHGVMSREGVAERYNRSNYFHPVYGLAGEVLTDDFPKDHYHHRGIFWAWTSVLVGNESKKYESWIPSNFNYVFEHWLCRETRDVAAVLGAEVSWQAGEKKVVREEWLVTVFPETDTGRVMDFEIVWTALAQPVTVKGATKKGYGGFSIRFAPRENTVVTTSRGKGEKDLVSGKAEWADLSATFSGAKAPSGVAIFVHPTHPDFPPGWLTREYGFLCPEYPGLKPATLEPGKPVRVAYRVWVHKGVPEMDVLQAQDKAYRQSTAVKLVAKP